MSKDNNGNDNNITPFRSIQGGATTTVVKEDSVPEFPYTIVDIEGDKYHETGFLIFTAQHVAIMTETEHGPQPVLMLPLQRLKYAEIDLDDSAEVTEP